MEILKRAIQDTVKNISNIPGWSSKKKIVVFEVDDWGAIRTRSKEARDNMIAGGLNLQKGRFDNFDTLANSKDLESLFEVLSKHKDKNGRTAVFTAVSVVANPDFDKIRSSGFNEYHYESLDETLKRYYPNENVLEVWRQGIDAKIFHPEFHGREHLNPGLWMAALKEGDKNVHLAFDNESIGARATSLRKYTGGYLSAFDFKDNTDRQKQEQVIEEGIKIFSTLFGYSPRHFTSSGLIHHPDIEIYLKDKGVEFIDVAKKQLEPQGGGDYKKKMYKLGQKNQVGQYYITRNSRFEPNDKTDIDWVSRTMSDIDIAFRWGKPALISSHRVNYVGGLDERNRENGLKMLDSLLQKLIKKWPDIEFMNVSELGDLIKK
jgi:hypothetical protein